MQTTAAGILYPDGSEFYPSAAWWQKLAISINNAVQAVEAIAQAATAAAAEAKFWQGATPLPQLPAGATPEQGAASIADLPTNVYAIHSTTDATARGLPTAALGTLWVLRWGTAAGQQIWLPTGAAFAGQRWYRDRTSAGYGPWRIGVMPVSLTATDNVDTLQAGDYLVSNVTIARALKLPEDYPGILEVKPISTGGGVVCQWTTAQQPPKVFVRSRLNSGTLSAWATVAVGGGAFSTGTVRRDLLQQALRARKGGAIGTGGKGVVTLRFDDAPSEFVTYALPKLRALGIPFTRVSTSKSISGTDLGFMTLPDMQRYCIADGGEVWNHGTDHLNATGETAIEANLIGALRDLRKAMPRIPVDCFAPPGGSSIAYDGHMPSVAVSNFADTYAGRLLADNHALVSGYYQNSYYRPLDGTLRDGQIHYSVDAYDLTRAKELIDRARDWRCGIVMMWHMNNVGSTGMMTIADFNATLDYLAAQRDAGNLLVLTKSGAAVADTSHAWRDDLLTTHAGTGLTPIDETILYPQYRQNVWGSTRVFTATIKHTTVQGIIPQAFLKIGTESQRTIYLGESGTTKVTHACTIPTDVTALKVTLSGGDTPLEVTEARLLAV